MLLLHHLDSRITSERDIAKEIVQNLLRHVAEMSNSNLVRNANYLMAKMMLKLILKLNLVSDIHLQNQTKFKPGY